MTKPTRVDYELPAKPYGGQLTVHGMDLVPMGDAMTHRRITYTRAADANRVGREIVFEVRDGIPQCVSLNLTPGDGGSIRPKDLADIALEKMIGDFFTRVGVFRPNPDGGWVHVHTRGDTDLFRRDRKVVERAVAQQRRTMTDELAKKVADVWNTAPAGDRIAAIQAAFTVSERTAKRYKKEAQMRGLIGDE